jgi:hypothetical protein
MAFEALGLLPGDFARCASYAQLERLSFKLNAPPIFAGDIR